MVYPSIFQSKTLQRLPNMKTTIEETLKALFANAHPAIDSLLIRIECPFDSGIGVVCEGKNSSGTVYPEPDMDALSEYVDQLRSARSSERFNIINIRMTSPTDIVIEKTFDESFQQEAENMVRD